MNQSVVRLVQQTPMGDNDNSGSDFPLDLNSIYIIIAVGALVIITVVAALALGIVYVCKASKRRVGRRSLKRNNTTRSSNASDFVYNSAYEWTCRQTRLLSHLNPDTTGYQSHWSLTRDVMKQRGTLQQIKSFQQGSTAKTDVSAAGEQSVVDTERENSGSDANDFEVCVNKGECVIFENNYSLKRDLKEIPRRLDVIHEISVSSDNLSDTSDLSPDMHTKLEEGPQQDDNNTTESLYAHRNSVNDSADMYSNPLYAKRKKKQGTSKREEKEREQWEAREKKNEGEEECMEEDNISKSSTAYYSLPAKSLGSFLICDSDAYDSGNASAVSTDISMTSDSITRKSAATWSTACKVRVRGGIRGEGRGIVESCSFEFANNTVNETVVK